MEKTYVVAKQDLSQFKNIRIVKMLMVSHLIMDLASEIDIGEREVTIKFSSLSKFGHYDESLFLALISIADWCFQETVLSSSQIEYKDSIKKSRDELMISSLSAFTAINIFADRNFNLSTFNAIIRKYADTINQWKKTAFERESLNLNHWQIDYICTSITEMLNRYKLYSEYKSGSLADQCGIDEQLIRDWYIKNSATNQLLVIPESNVFGFKVIDNKIKENPFFILVITKCYTDLINDDLSYYCMKNLSGTDKVLCNVVFTAAKYL